jgi:hypothetical protein
MLVCRYCGKHVPVERAVLSQDLFARFVTLCSSVCYDFWIGHLSAYSSLLRTAAEMHGRYRPEEC